MKNLKNLLRYVPETGEWFWINHPVFPSYSGRLVKRSVTKDGYLRTSIFGDRVLLHRLAFLYMTGDFPPFEVDHINGDKQDNRWENLRAVTRQENTLNHAIRENTSSGITGVSWNTAQQRWIVYITRGGVRHHGGCHVEKEKAVHARRHLEQTHFGEYARGIM